MTIPASAPRVSRGPDLPVLAEVVRSGFVESRHRGSLVVLAADGRVEWSVGEVAEPIFPRSSNKPMQAAAVLRAGLPLADERLALAAASHRGAELHQRLADRMLAEHGLTAAALRCPEEAPDFGAGPGPRGRLAMNCSGKHAAWLAASVVNEWPVADYLDPEHPMQRLARRTVVEYTGEPETTVGVDGCGAPLSALSATGLARAFRAAVLGPADDPLRRVADAMRAHPEYVAGEGRLDTVLMRAVPGLLAKGGAEGVQAVALPDGRAFALKVEDGAGRAANAVTGRVLAALGVEAGALPDTPVLGGGEPVGEVRAAF
ncbi:asparaginase [Streptomyces sp. DSM 44915]|uniref:Asparaginase n=1 Tax=Streptomyces chisholmiae TaxID=3075540 RepID=A0ABU2K0S3_9ACTN|nr:asparaginase [Streptomyces sp. DSM 44915]MDT0270839.1 asparaginase [Streptomyces sp. DSM 44915]